MEPVFKSSLVLGLTMLIMSMFSFLILANVPLDSNHEHNQSKQKSEQQILTETLFIFSFAMISLALSVVFVPSLTGLSLLSNVLSHLKKSIYTLSYVFFLMIFYTNVPADIINNYHYIFNGITVSLGFLSFYLGTREEKREYVPYGYVPNKQANLTFSSNEQKEIYEKIKLVITFFAFIATLLIYYVINPGNIVGDYFGYAMVPIIVASILGFVGVIAYMSLKQSPTPSIVPEIFFNISNFNVWGTILFLAYIILTGFFILLNPKVLQNDTIVISVTLIGLIIGVCWTIGFFALNPTPPKPTYGLNSDFPSNIKKALIVLIGLALLGTLLFSIIYGTSQLNSVENVTFYIFNLILILLILGFIYRIAKVELPHSSKSSPVVELFVSFFYWLPCLFSSWFSKIGAIITRLFSGFKSSSTAFKNTPFSDGVGSFIMLASICGLYLATYGLSYGLPKIANYFTTQGGQQLVGQPISTNTQSTVASYDDLHKNPSDSKYDYRYGLSFWIFLDAMPPNTNENYTKYTSLLNFGEKPNILYNASTNSLIITVETQNKSNNTNTTDNANNEELSESGNKIVYKLDNVLLQKWNHFAINYEGGTLDVFLNGELVKSTPNVVPYYSYDSLVVGVENGVNGGLCNLCYYDTPLTMTQIYYIYNSLKSSNPPVVDASQRKIINDTTKKGLNQGWNKIQ